MQINSQTFEAISSSDYLNKEFNLNNRNLEGFSSIKDTVKYKEEELKNNLKGVLFDY